MTDLRRQRLRDCAYICLAQVVVVLVLRPFRDVPFIDDGCYAWPVEHLLATGRLATLEYANNVNLAQVLWGALFCLPGGFSFAALRVSTWVASTGGLCLFYLLLRELGAGRRDALIGTALLGLNPIYFILQFSFMTDVPFLALTVGATWAFVRAVNGRRTSWLAAAALMASLACGVRVVGVVWPIAAALSLLVMSWGRRPIRLAIVLTPQRVVGGVGWWNAGHVVRPADLSELPNSPDNRLRDLKEFGLPLLPRMIPAALGSAVAVLGIGLLPLAVGMLTWRRAAWGALAVTGLLIVLWFSPEPFQPLHSGATWSWSELGYVEVPNRPSYPPPVWLGRGLAALAVVSAGMLLAGLPRPREIRPVLAWQVVGHVLVVAAIWLFYDRFALILIPLVVGLLLAGQAIVRPRWALGLIVPLTTVCFIGTRDHIAYAAAHSQALAELRRLGAKENEIDAGYSSNAWRQYAHPADAPRDSAGRVLVPAFNTDVVPRYQLSHVEMPGTRTLGSVAFRRWIGPSGRIYLLEYPYRLSWPGKQGHLPRPANGAAGVSGGRGYD